MNVYYQLRENWLPLISAFSLVLLAAFGIYRADLTDGLGVLIAIVPIAFIAGVLLSSSVFSRRTSLLFSLVYAGFFIFVIVGRNHAAEIDSWRERIIHLINLQGDWIGKFADGGTSREPIIFIMHTSAVFWIMGYSAAWWTQRSDKIWRVVVPSGMVLLSVVYYYFGPRPLWMWLATYIVASFLYIAFTWLNVQQTNWRDHNVFFEKRLGLNVAVAGFTLALATLVIAWQVPTLEANPSVTAALDNTTPTWQKFQNTWTRLFSSLRTYSAPTSDSFSNNLTLGGARDVSESLVMDVFVEEELPYAYWHAISYESYEDGLWDIPEGDTVEYIPDEGLIDIPKYESRQTITQTVRNYLPSAGQIYGMPDIIGSDRQMFLTSRTLPGESIEQINKVQSKYVLQQGEVYNSASQFSVATQFELQNASTNYPEWADSYLALPDTISQRTRDLAEEVTEGQTNPYDQAIAIQNFLREHIEYNDQIDAPPNGVDPVDYVLFEDPEGYCNYYSSAMVVMLRHKGIPSRPASGFAGGEFIEDAGLYRVRLQDAHTWVEAYFPQYGWIQFEPTASIIVPSRPTGGLAAENEAEIPPALPDPGGPNFLEDDLFPGGEGFEDFSELEPPPTFSAEIITIPAVLSIVLILLAAAAFLYTSLNNRRVETDLIKSYDKLGQWGESLGVPIAASQTPIERAQALSDAIPSGQKPIDNITNQLITTRYSEDKVGDPNFNPQNEWKELRPLLNREWVNQKLSAVRRLKNRFF